MARTPGADKAGQAGFRGAQGRGHGQVRRSRPGRAGGRGRELIVRAVLASLPARADRENEDFAAVTPSAAVLLDGAGIPAGLESGCLHGVAWYARTLGTVLLARITTAGSGPLADCLHDAIGEVRDRHSGSCDLGHDGSPSATVVAARASGDQFEYLVLSDSALVLSEVSGATRVLTDQRIEEVSRAHRAVLDRTPIGAPEHDAVFADYIRAARGLKNTAAGFWVASADPAAAGHALTGTVPLANIRAVLLLSDGASRLADVFGLVSWEQLADLVSAGGPAELIRLVRAAEATDPDGLRWPRGKATDDATAVRCDQFGPDAG
jgi:Protein phosphatase 2C